MKKWVSICFILLVFTTSYAQTADTSILIINTTLHIGNGEIIKNGAIGIRNHTIDFVGVEVQANKANYQMVIDAERKHCYPGFIAVNTSVGLSEIEAIRATNDDHEVGQFSPSIRAYSAYNVDSRVLPTLVSNGILTLQSVPRGGLLAGSSCVVNTSGFTVDEVVVKKEDGLHLYWPKAPDIRKQRRNENNAKDPGKEHQEKIQELERYIVEAKTYAKADFHMQKNIGLEAINRTLSENRKLYIHADRYQDILDVIAFIRRNDLKNIVLVGGYDAWLAADLLNENQIAVMLNRVHSLPMREDDDVELPYKMPKILWDKGVLFCLENSGDMENIETRNLGFYAGTAARYGLSQEEALQMITLNAAKVLGVEKELGSLEVGKTATIFLSKGNPLEIKSNDITHVWISGQSVDLTADPQKQLFEKYKKRYGLE